MEQRRILSGGSRPAGWSQQDLYEDERRRDAYQPAFLPDLRGHGLLGPGDRRHAIWHPGRGIYRSVIPSSVAVGLGKEAIRVVACHGQRGALGHATAAALRPLPAWRKIPFLPSI